MNIKHGAVILAMSLLAACSSTPRVRADNDTKASIANYHSYVWEQISDNASAGGPAFSNPLNQKRLRAAIDANLQQRGLQPAAQGTTPDSYVSLSIGTRQTLETERYPVRVGLGWGWWRPGFGGSLGWSTTDGINAYREDRITLDLYDAKTREAIWHASVDQDLSYLTGKDAEARINKLVDAMFAKFPGATSTP